MMEWFVTMRYIYIYVCKSEQWDELGWIKRMIVWKEGGQRPGEREVQQPNGIIIK